MREGRLWRETSFDLGTKLWQINWLYVMLLCKLAAVGYVALYSAAGGARNRTPRAMCCGLPPVWC